MSQPDFLSRALRTFHGNGQENFNNACLPFITPQHIQDVDLSIYQFDIHTILRNWVTERDNSGRAVICQPRALSRRIQEAISWYCIKDDTKRAELWPVDLFKDGKGRYLEFLKMERELEYGRGRINWYTMEPISFEATLEYYADYKAIPIMEKLKARDKSVSVHLHPKTFHELKLLSANHQISLKDLYPLAIRSYLKESKPERLKVLAAPEYGKTVRVHLDRELNLKLSEQISIEGFKATDVVYTALEHYLGNRLV